MSQCKSLALCSFTGVSTCLDQLVPYAEHKAVLFILVSACNVAIHGWVLDVSVDHISDERDPARKG